MRDELYREIIMVLMQEGYDTESVKSKLVMILNDYDIQPRSTDIIPYEGNDIDKFIKMFLINKRVAGRTERTLHAYEVALKAFFGEICKSPLEVTSDDIKLFLATKEIRDGVSKVYQKHLMRCISSFYEWMTREEHVSKNPMNKVENIKIPKVKKEAFTEMQIEMLRAETVNDIRISLIFELLLSTWCRVSELAQIRLDEIDNDSIIIHGKGQKDRICYMNAKSKIFLSRYLGEREDTNPYLFPNSISAVGNKGDNAISSICKVNGQRFQDWWKIPSLVGDSHIDKSSIENHIRKLGKRAGVKNTHPHRFRRTGATMALKRGMPIEKVSKLLGHESLETTQIYLDLSEDDLRISHERYV